MEFWHGFTHLNTVHGLVEEGAAFPIVSGTVGLSAPQCTHDQGDADWQLPLTGA